MRRKSFELKKHEKFHIIDDLTNSLLLPHRIGCGECGGDFDGGVDNKQKFGRQLHQITNENHFLKLLFVQKSPQTMIVDFLIRWNTKKPVKRRFFSLLHHSFQLNWCS
jgi:hypothetical protein